MAEHGEGDGNLRYLELVRPYAGDRPARAWAGDFQRVAHTAGWDDGMALLVAGSKLTGKAQQWYSLRSPFDSTANFLQRLQVQYPTPPAGDALNELRCCKIQPGESVKDFAVRFEIVAQYADVPENFKLNLFYNAGLPHHVQAALYHTRPATLAAAITEAMEAERFSKTVVGPAMDQGLTYDSPYRNPDGVGAGGPSQPPPPRQPKVYDRDRRGPQGGAAASRGGPQAPPRPNPAPAAAPKKDVMEELAEQMMRQLTLNLNDKMAHMHNAKPQASFVQLSGGDQDPEPTAGLTPLQQRVYNVYVGEKRAGAEPMEVEGEAPVKRMARKPRVAYRVPLGAEPEAGEYHPATPAGARARAPGARANPMAARSGELEYQMACDLLHKTKQNIPLDLYVQADHKKVHWYVSEFLRTGKMPLPQELADGTQAPGMRAQAVVAEARTATDSGSAADQSYQAVTYRSANKQARRWTVLRCEDVYLCGERITCVVDTGASVTIFTEALLTKFGLMRMVKPTPATTIDVADGSNVEVTGMLPNVPITIAGCTLKVDALVTKALSYDALIGCDWLCPMGVTIDMGNRELVVAGNRVVSLDCGNGFIEASYVGHFVEHQARASMAADLDEWDLEDVPDLVDGTEQEELYLEGLPGLLSDDTDDESEEGDSEGDEEDSELDEPEGGDSDEDADTPPGLAGPGDNASNEDADEPPGLTEPDGGDADDEPPGLAETDSEDDAADEDTRRTWDEARRDHGRWGDRYPPFTLEQDFLPEEDMADDQAAVLQYLSAQTLRDMVLTAGRTPADGPQALQDDSGPIPRVQEPLVAAGLPVTTKDLSSAPLVFDINPNLNPTQQEQLQQVLDRYKGVFSFSKRDLRTTTFGCHDIILKDGAKPKAAKPYRHSPVERAAVEEEVNKQLELGLIEPAISEWASPVLLVPKKSGDLRMAVDYRYLNSQTVPDSYPLPNIEDILGSLEGVQYVTALDMRAGYYQIPMTERASDYSTFTTHMGTFKPKFLTFGLRNAPGNFSRIMTRCLGDRVGKGCFVYIDDIVCASPTFEQHLRDLETTLKRLQDGGFTLAAEKCHFAKRECTFLGHLVTPDGIRVDPSKVADLLAMPAPTGLRQLRTFLGLASYYRRFVPDFATLAAPLVRLLKKTEIWRWGEAQQKSFSLLKERLANAPVLRHPDYSKPFVVYTDYSKDGLGAILAQESEDGEYVVQYASRRTSEAEQKLGVTEGELLAAIFGCERFRPFIYGTPFKLVVDHTALAYLKQGRNTSSKLTRWALRLEEFDYEPVYRAGKSHTNVDSLSRLPAAYMVLMVDQAKKLRKTGEAVAACKQQGKAIAKGKSPAATSAAVAAGPSAPKSTTSDEQPVAAELKAGDKRAYLSLSPDPSDESGGGEDSEGEDLDLKEGQDPYKFPPLRRKSLGDTQVPRFNNTPVKAVTADTSCQLCGQASGAADMDLCDHCNQGYHRYCLSPAHKRPDGEQGFWYCLKCLVDDSTLNACDPAEDLALHSLLKTGRMPVTRDEREMARLRSRRTRYELDQEGRLYKRPTDKYEARLVVPVAERPEKLSWHHDEMGHPGAATMYETLRQLYWWPQMAADCREYVDGCSQCLAYQPLPRTYVPMRPSPLGEFMGRWCIDSSGKLSKTEAGNQYLIIAMDTYSKWPEAVAVPKLDSQATAEFFKREIIHRYGPPISVTHDNGPEYQLAFQELLAKHGIESKPSMAMRPTSNGLAERTVRTIKERLAKSGGADAARTWDQELPGVMYGMRVAAQSTTQVSPYRVLFGRNAPSLSGRRSIDHAGQEVPIQEADASVAALHERMLANVTVNQAKQVVSFAKRHRHLREATKVAVGQLVYTRNHEKGKKGELRPKVLGPFEVTEIKGPLVYVCGGVCPDGARREWAEHLTDVVPDKRAVESADEGEVE